MDNNINSVKIPLGNNQSISSSNEEDNNSITDSYNYNLTDAQDIQNNYYISNQINIFKQQLEEYERNYYRNNNQQFHFDFKGELSKDIKNENIIKTSDIDINKENYPKDFFIDINIEKRCKIFTDSKYAVFENKLGENSCYLNVLLHFLYNINDIRSYLIDLYQSKKSKKSGHIIEKEEDIETEKSSIKIKEKDKNKNSKVLANNNKIYLTKEE